MFSWDKITRRPDGKVQLLYRHERMFDEGLFDTPCRVLDVGGWGVLATRLLEDGHQCFILDTFSEDQYYPERVKSLRYIEADVTDLSSFVGYGKFDIVTCFEMLEHCCDQPQALKNMCDILHFDGFLVGTFPIPGKVHQEDEPGVNFLTEQELLGLLNDAGFVSISIEPTGSVHADDEPCSLYFKARK